MLGNGGTTDPLQWYGLSFLILSWILLFILTQKVFYKYLKGKSKSLLYAAFAQLSLGVAIFFLFFERVFLIILHNEVLGMISALIAIISSGFVMLFVILFAIYHSFPDHAQKIWMVSIILIIIYISGAISTINDIQITPTYEIEFPTYMDVILLCVVGPLTILGFSIFSYYIYQMRSISPPHGKRAFYLLLSTILLISAFIPEIMGFSEIIGYFRFLFLPSIILYYICFTRFYELEWSHKIRHFYVIHQIQGTCIYNHSFVQEHLIDSGLIAGSISGFSSLIQEITLSKRRLKIIDLEDIKILMEHGDYIIGALMTVENFKILRKKLISFVQTFENQFKEHLTHFTGSIDEFQPTKEIIKQIFSYGGTY